MCVMSMVHDHFAPVFPPLPAGTIATWPPSAVIVSQEEADRLRGLIADFRSAIEAARVVDKLTAQPDCADPEKLKLEDRVARLERALAEMRQARA